jgi:hypothetical protein
MLIFPFMMQRFARILQTPEDEELTQIPAYQCGSGLFLFELPFAFHVTAATGRETAGGNMKQLIGSSIPVSNHSGIRSVGRVPFHPIPRESMTADIVDRCLDPLVSRLHSTRAATVPSRVCATAFPTKSILQFVLFSASCSKLEHTPIIRSGGSKLMTGASRHPSNPTLDGMARFSSRSPITDKRCHSSSTDFHPFGGHQ